MKEKERIVQFNVPNSTVSYDLKLVYDSNLLIHCELLSLRSNNRTTSFGSLYTTDKKNFINHYKDKISNMPITND